MPPPVPFRAHHVRVRRWFRRSHHVEVVYRRGTLLLGPRAIARRAIRDALLIPRNEGARVRLTLTRGSHVVLEFERIIEAERLTRVLELDATRRALSVSLTPTIARRFGPLRLLAVLMIGAPWLAYAQNVLAWCIGLCGTIATLVTFSRRTIRIGNDGLGDRWLRRWRFTPIGDIARVRVAPVKFLVSEDWYVVVDTYSSRHVTINAGTETCARLLEHRIRTVVTDAAIAETTQDLTSVLEHDGRTPRRWLEDLRALLAQHATTGYRARAIERADLEVAATDPNRPPHLRLAAALALEAPSKAERARLREIADASAHATLAPALRHVADDPGDESRHRRALAALVRER